MSNMTITVDLLAGTEIKRAVEEAKALALKLDVAFVKFPFNGVSMSISSKADAMECEELFHEALGKAKGLRFVIR